ncbi:TspO protein [Sphingobacteriaceae bacterium]|nr:TspO protein [Sphingobacteriaceae bacterium]
MNKILKLILCILLPLSIGALSGVATASGVRSWYLTLEKPFFNPPDYLFAPVWTVLYLLMGISFYLVLQSKFSRYKRRAIQIFVLQLILNFLWSFLFFKFHLITAALIDIVLMWLSILLMIFTFYEVDKKAGLLQVPYLLWVTFATLLNASIWMLN